MDFKRGDRVAFTLDSGGEADGKLIRQGNDRLWRIETAAGRHFYRWPHELTKIGG